MSFLVFIQTHLSGEILLRAEHFSLIANECKKMNYIIRAVPGSIGAAVFVGNTAIALCSDPPVSPPGACYRKRRVLSFIPQHHIPGLL